jgi:hypothetical protein
MAAMSIFFIVVIFIVVHRREGTLCLIAARLLNHIAGRDRPRDPKLWQTNFRIIPM